MKNYCTKLFTNEFHFFAKLIFSSHCKQHSRWSKHSEYDYAKKCKAFQCKCQMSSGNTRNLCELEAGIYMSFLQQDIWTFMRKIKNFGSHLNMAILILLWCSKNVWITINAKFQKHTAEVVKIPLFFVYLGLILKNT